MSRSKVCSWALAPIRRAEAQLRTFAPTTKNDLEAICL